MKKIIWALTALIILSTFFGNIQLSATPPKQIVVTLQSKHATADRETLRRSGEIMTARLEAFGIRDFKVVPNYKKGQLQASFTANDQLDAILGLLSAKGALRFYETATGREFNDLLDQMEDTRDLRSLLYPGNDPAKKKGDQAILATAGIRRMGAINRLLNSRELTERLPANWRFAWSYASNADGTFDLYTLQLDDDLHAITDGSHIQEVALLKSEQLDNFIIAIAFDEAGTQLWADGTARNVGRHIAIAVDQQVYMAPRVIDPILNGKLHITGNFTEEETTWLAALIKGGELPVALEIVSIE